jgi:hypothetical protein
LTLYSEFNAGTAIELNEIDGIEFITLTESSLAALGVMDRVAQAHLAELIRNRPPVGLVSKGWDANDVQAWCKARGVYPITDGMVIFLP